MSLYVPWDVFHDEAMTEQDDMSDPVAFAASSNPDIMCYDDAMRAPDSDKFYSAMMDEVAAHRDNDHWEIIPKAEVPKHQPVLPAVWAFRRKRRIATNEVYKWKARLNVHGGRQEHGVNYWQTHSPVVGWSTIRLFLNLMILNGWTSRQVDFVLAFPQAEIECDIFMEVPVGFEVNGSRKDYALHLKRNLYGQKQAGRIWNIYMHDGLIARGFVQSKVDMCVCYKGSVALMAYVDDGIFIGPDKQQIQACYDELTKPYTDENGVHFRAFKMTDEGDISDYLY